MKSIKIKFDFQTWSTAILIFTILSMLIPFQVKSQGCLPQGIVFNSQSQIDSFLINYPGCTEIEGGVTISGSDITNLQGLSTITKIDWWLNIVGNDSLVSLNGMDLLDSIGWGMQINGNNNLQSLSGLGSLKFISGDFWLVENHKLQNFDGLNSLKYIGGSFYPQSNNSLINFIGLDSLVHIGEGLVIYNNNSMINFSGIEKLTTIDGLLEISNNDSIIDFTGFEGVETIQGRLIIDQNGNLLSLNGLQSLQTVNEMLFIYNNINLTDIFALEDVVFNVGGNFSLQNNISLSDCSILSVCGYLAYIPPGHIFNNAPNCNTTEEVDSICNSIGIENIEPLPDILILPNPASKILDLNLTNGSLDWIEIYSQSGQLQQIIKSDNSQLQIDISGLSPGNYFIRAITREEVFVRKFVVVK
ncbi:MAG: T9SS type A sorting domain-containing protein [Bacteroidales bacterium]|nr:T9SS type A sorting domain-containing protein [Bacteroidales bacterium]